MKRTDLTKRDWVLLTLGTLLSISVGLSSLLFSKELIVFDPLILNKIFELTLFGCSGLPIAIVVTIVFYRNSQRIPCRKKRSRKNR